MENKTMNMTMLAVSIGGTGFIHQLLVLFIVAVCILIIWALCRYACGVFQAPPIVMKVINGLFILVGAIFLINFLLGLAGEQYTFIRW